MSNQNPISKLKQRLFSKNVASFLICLGIASFLWIIHTLNRNYKYTIQVPVKFTNLPSNKSIVGELPDKLQIDIKASGLKLLFISLKKEFQTLSVDFNSLKTNAKSQAYSLGTGNINLNQSINFDVDIIKIRPDTLFFSLNKGPSKIVPVKVNSVLTFIPGYQLMHAPVANPSYITITGDSIALQRIDTVYTQTISENNLKSDLHQKIGLKKVNTQIYYNTNEVVVNASVEKVTEGTIMIPIQIQHLPKNIQLKLLPSELKIQYIVALKDFENIDKNSFKAMVDYNAINEGKKTLPVELFRTPSEVKIINTEPANVKYIIYK